MSGVRHIEIIEEVEALRELMKAQKTALNFAKVQSLYLLRISAVETVRCLAVFMGRSEMTIHRWLRLYREGGIEALLEEKKPPGRSKKIDAPNGS